MKLIDVELDVVEDTYQKRTVTIELPKNVKLGKHRFVIIIEERFNLEDETLEPEIDLAFKAELDRRLEDMEKNPHPGFKMKDVLQELEVEIGRKIQTRTIS